MYVNIINSYRDVVAICDEDLLGKLFFEEEKQLHIKENFYKGEKGKKANKNEILDIMKIWSQEDATFNIVGKESVAIALEAELITEEGIKTIDGIPYAMVLL